MDSAQPESRKPGSSDSQRPAFPCGCVLAVTVLAAGAAAVLTVAVAALLININQRKIEARDPFFRVAELTADTDDPAVWGRNFPGPYGLYDTIKTRRAAGATATQLAEAATWQRKAQYYIDFVDSENSMGFHASQEAMRIYGTAVDFCRKGQMALQ